MDIAKYIGLFLLKNHFCYVHGLGNMELNKRPAMHDGKSLQPPSYEVVVTPGGSIDDNLANFIAINEQISISKAANALREYSIQARKDMAMGKEVPVPNIGKFVEQNGRVKFITDEKFSFTPAGIPTIRNSKQLDEQNAKLSHKPSYPPPPKADSVNWSMVILVIVLLIIVGGGVYGIWYYSHQNSTNNNVVVQPVDTALLEPAFDSTDVAVRDSMAVIAPPAVDTLQVNAFKMIIGNYPTRAKAERRQHNLEQLGNRVDVIQQDSVNYYVLTTIHCRMVDTTHVIDSLETLFGYKNVMTYR
jgi:hypothetical protein